MIVLQLPDCKCVRLSADTIIKPFDCGDVDLNDFLFNDARHYADQLLTVTYLYEYGDKTVAFYSVLNDRIVQEDCSGRSARERFLKPLPRDKRHCTLSAVKIGRLGVSQEFKGGGIGSQILDFIKIWFTNGNKTGCRFITVDAYNNPSALAFYRGNGFLDFPGKIVNEKTVPMYFDLITVVNAAKTIAREREEK